MKASKLAVLTVVAVFGSIGVASAQAPSDKPQANPTPPKSTTPADTQTQFPAGDSTRTSKGAKGTSSSPSDMGTGTGTTARSDTRAMSSERPAKADRN